MAVRDKIFGSIISLLAILLAVIYVYAMVWGGYALLAVQIVVTLGFLTFLAIVFWVGYTIVTTPTIEEIQKKKK